MFDASGQAAQCRNGTTVPNPTTNTGLVADCDALWAAKDTFRGTITLNWNATTAVSNWQGITVAGTPQRVTSISFLSNIRPPIPGKLNGSLPTEFGNLTALQRLDVQQSSLTGSIPPELANLSNLQDLTLQGNNLTGSIPPQLANLSNLTQLNLQDNNLTGSIPPQLANLSNLGILYLGENSLTGPIPSELGGISTLLGLRLEYNRLSGEFPRWVANLNSLQFFQIQGNRLTGHLPLDNPLSASVTQWRIGRFGGDPPGAENMWIGCIPSWATANSAVRGEENLDLPNCGTPLARAFGCWTRFSRLPPPFAVRAGRVRPRRR